MVACCTKIERAVPSIRHDVDTATLSAVSLRHAPRHEQALSWVAVTSTAMTKWVRNLGVMRHCAGSDTLWVS